MPNFAIIEDGIVSNIIVADSKEIAESLTKKNCIESSEENRAYIGLKYNQETGIFDQPDSGEVLYVSPIDGSLVSKEEFDTILAGIEQ